MNTENYIHCRKSPKNVWQFVFDYRDVIVFGTRWIRFCLHKSAHAWRHDSSRSRRRVEIVMTVITGSWRGTRVPHWLEALEPPPARLDCAIRTQLRVQLQSAILLILYLRAAASWANQCRDMCSRVCPVPSDPWPARPTYSKWLISTRWCTVLSSFHIEPLSPSKYPRKRSFRLIVSLIWPIVFNDDFLQ